MVWPGKFDPSPSIFLLVSLDVSTTRADNGGMTSHGVDYTQGPLGQLIDAMPDRGHAKVTSQGYNSVGFDALSVRHEFGALIDALEAERAENARLQALVAKLAAAV